MRYDVFHLSCIEDKTPTVLTCCILKEKNIRSTDKALRQDLKASLAAAIEFRIWLRTSFTG